VLGGSTEGTVTNRKWCSERSHGTHEHTSGAWLSEVELREMP
jgi:hypothetical protein